jgi:hypothetical protein
LFGVKTYLKISLTIFGASIVGWVVLLFFVPEQLSSSDPPLTSSERVLYWFGIGLASPSLPLGLLIEWLRPPLPGWTWILAACFISSLFWGLLVFAGRRWWTGRPTEPTASQNGGPAARLANSCATGGPPSVS